MTSLSFPGLFSICLASSFLFIAKVAADGNNYMAHPAAGEVIPVGKPYEIVWSPGTPGPVFIALLDNTGEGTGNLTASTPNNGSFTWTPLPILADYNNGGDYFMQICDRLINDCTYTFDGRFNFSNANSGAQTSSSTTTTTRLITSTQQPLSTSSTTSSLSKSTDTISSSIESSTSANPPSVSTSSSDSLSKQPSDGLSTSAKIAIGVVVSILGTIALLVAGFFLYRRHWRSRGVHQPIHDVQSLPIQRNAVYEKATISDHGNARQPTIHELDSYHRM